MQRVITLGETLVEVQDKLQEGLGSLREVPILHPCQVDIVVALGIADVHPAKPVLVEGIRQQGDAHAGLHQGRDHGGCRYVADHVGG